MDGRLEHRRIAAGLLLLGGLSGCVAAGPAPVCDRPDVVARVGDILGRQGRTVVFEAPAGEVSIATPSVGAATVASCALRAHTVGFDTNRYGNTPTDEPFTVRYTVELRQNGSFVRIE